MSRGDRPAVTKILGNTPEFKPFEVQIAEELIDSYLQDSTGSGYHVLVAETDSTVTGYICYGPTPMTEGTWDIYWMAVAPERQGQGIGSRLIQPVLTQADKDRVPWYLETQTERNVSFYRKRGFEVVSDGWVPDQEIRVWTMLRVPQ